MVVLLDYNCKPVSYTHLDVYKRQVLNSYFPDLDSFINKINKKYVKPACSRDSIKSVITANKSSYQKHQTPYFPRKPPTSPRQHT